MKDEMIEAKKDTYKQCQKGVTRMGFTFKHSELPETVKDAELGHRYYIVFVDADVYDESMGKTVAPLTCYKENRNVTTKITTEKSEGEKLRQSACILCGEASFQKYVQEVYVSLDECELGETAENLARCMIVDECNIDSRKELVTNKEAQEKFRELDRAYIEWGKPSVDEQYKHNLEM